MIIKLLIKFFLAFVFIIFFSLIYLSYFGIKTDKFDDLIKEKTNEVNRHFKLDFKETKIHLNPQELKLVVRLQNPEIIVKENRIILSKLDLFLPIQSFFTSDFILKKAEIAFSKNDIKDITKITNAFLPRIINKQLNKIFLEGKIEGEVLIPFKTDGSIGKDYGFSGKISNASINITKEFPLRNLTLEIGQSKDSNKNIFTTTITKGTFYDFDLSRSKINLEKINEQFKIKSLIITNGKFDFEKFKKLLAIFNQNIDDIKNINGDVNIQTEINFEINKRYQINNLSYITTGDINYFEVETEKNPNIKKYLPSFNSKITFKNLKVNFLNSKEKFNIKLNGLIKLSEKFDKIEIDNTFNYDKKIFQVNGKVDLTNSEVKISRLNFEKNSGKKSELIFDLNFILNNYFNIKNLNFISEKNKIFLSNVKMNKNFELIDFKNIEIKTYKNKFKNNDFSIEKSKKVVIEGEIFDAQPLLKSLFKKSDKKTFSKKFTSEVKINFNKALTGTNDDVSNFGMIASIKKGSFDKLSLKGNFSQEEIVEMSIYQENNDKKTLQVISDRARPFMKNFDFIKGFEEGKLQYESIISKTESSSNLLITDFKVSEVPALAQLLTLASLQGIADTLSGEGIRFDSFEMKSNSKDNVMNIEDALAMGPAVSILISGYVDKGKIVSLRGTLVPATKLNSIIASIPLVGDILVGKKTGEGVVGVSFKMKGPPKNIKTTVNPIKTLTPRFIVRAVEKMKKRKKEKTK